MDRLFLLHDNVKISKLLHLPLFKVVERRMVLGLKRQSTRHR